MSVISKKEVINEMILLFKVISIESYTSLYTNLPSMHRSIP